ncbi:MAG TPA: hypothetical protein VF692_11180, partial [Pyrinomonadaceae bacterium]
MKVLKFGGSSVGNAESIEKVVAIIKTAVEIDSCVVVLSAMQGTTDALIDAAKSAASGNEDFREKIVSIKEKHIAAIGALLPENERGAITDFVASNIDELEKICEGVFLVGELSPRTLDKIVGFGEILSTRIAAAKFDSLGVENVWKDARELIKTDSNFGFAAVDFQKTNELIEDFFIRQIQNPKSKAGNLFIVPGFIASDANNITTTLGRGGSDYTAAI